MYFSSCFFLFFFFFVRYLVETLADAQDAICVTLAEFLTDRYLSHTRNLKILI